ncbi:MAG: MMPL family transporter [Saprospiraceae bacterium]|nr:MMPL family transporter [Saprospiraceae bacterium]
MAGKIKIEQIYIKEIKANLFRYLLISGILIGTSLLLILRSFTGIIIPFLIIAISVIWTLSLMTLAQFPIDAISSLIPPALAIIGMSTMIHFIFKYKELFSAGYSKQHALEKTFKEIGFAIFCTSLTTAIGFFTLSFTNIIPVRIFGIFAGIGVLLSFLITMVLFYAINKISPLPLDFNNQNSERKWTIFLGNTFAIILKHKFRILGIYTILVLAAGYYINKIEINGRFLDEIPKHHPILKDYKFLENDFYGTRNFEMVLSINNVENSFYNLATLKEVESVLRFLKDSCNMGSIISPLSLIKAATKAYHGGDNKFYKLPETQNDINLYTQNIMQTQYADEMQRYILQNGSKLRISGKLPDLKIQEINILNNRIDAYFKTQDSEFSFNYSLTGFEYILDKIPYSLIKNLFTGLLIAFLVIMGIGVYMLGSWRMLFIALIPNLLTLLFMASLMGYLGIYLKSDTAIIFQLHLALQ